MLDHLAARAIPGVETTTGQRYERTIQLANVHGIVGVAEGAYADSLAITIRFPDVRELPRIVFRLRRMLDLDANIGTIAAHLADDPWLAPLVAGRPGLRVPGTWDGYELAVRAILGQQVSVAHSRTLAGQLAEVAGARYSGPASSEGLELVFPTPEQVLRTSLAAIRMPTARREAVTGLSELVMTDSTLFAPWRQQRAVTERLMRLPGIGAWTTDYVRLRALRDPDAFPATDAGLLRALARRAGRAVSPTQARAMGEAWRPWRAYAGQHFWTSDHEAATSGDSSLEREAVA